MARYGRGIATLARIHLGGLSRSTEALAGKPRPCQDNDHETDDDGGDTVLACGCTAYLLCMPTPFPGFSYAIRVYTTHSV